MSNRIKIERQLVDLLNVFPICDQSTVMNINRYGRTYRNGILVAKFRVSYVKIT